MSWRTFTGLEEDKQLVKLARLLKNQETSVHYSFLPEAPKVTITTRPPGISR
jgi:hypothetical protein